MQSHSKHKDTLTYTQTHTHTQRRREMLKWWIPSVRGSSRSWRLKKIKLNEQIAAAGCLLQQECWVYHSLKRGIHWFLHIQVCLHIFGVLEHIWSCMNTDKFTLEAVSVWRDTKNLAYLISAQTNGLGCTIHWSNLRVCQVAFWVMTRFFHFTRRFFLFYLFFLSVCLALVLQHQFQPLSLDLNPAEMHIKQQTNYRWTNGYNRPSYYNVTYDQLFKTRENFVWLHYRALSLMWTLAFLYYCLWLLLVSQHQLLISNKWVLY